MKITRRDFLKMMALSLLLIILLPIIPIGTASEIEVGKKLFIANQCVLCHTVSGVPGATGTMGPELSDTGSRKDKAYIKESIINPSATIVEGYTDLMTPFGFDKKFTEEELNNLVAFLASLKIAPTRESAPNYLIPIIMGTLIGVGGMTTWAFHSVQKKKKRGI